MIILHFSTDPRTQRQRTFQHPWAMVSMEQRNLTIRIIAIRVHQRDHPKSSADEIETKPLDESQPDENSESAKNSQSTSIEPKVSSSANEANSQPAARQHPEEKRRDVNAVRLNTRFCHACYIPVSPS